ncbi:hypothetical protein [Micromonospora halophytica]|uniref:hypothetical protein n=1 Tax=Micromonospora halophytica TaxID=47864 RepID=UPI000B822119|nr:hypothetical protein [Micromonospora halophytica]
MLPTSRCARLFEAMLVMQEATAALELEPGLRLSPYAPRSRAFASSTASTTAEFVLAVTGNDDGYVLDLQDKPSATSPETAEDRCAVRITTPELTADVAEACVIELRRSSTSPTAFCGVDPSTSDPTAVDWTRDTTRRFTQGSPTRTRKSPDGDVENP